MKLAGERINLLNKWPYRLLLTLTGLFSLLLVQPGHAAKVTRVVVLAPIRIGEAVTLPDSEAEGVARAIQFEIASPGAVEVVPQADLERYQKAQGTQPGTELGFDQAFELARMGGARFVIWGSFQKIGDVYRFNMVVGDALNETVKKLRSTRSDLFGIQDDLAAQSKKLIQQAGAPVTDDLPKAVTLTVPEAAAPKPAATVPAGAPPVDRKRQARELFNLGARLGDYSDRERDYYIKAGQTDPDFAEPHYALGEFYYQRQQHKDSLASFETYLRMKPNAPEAGDVRMIIADLRKQLGLPPDAPPVAVPAPAPAPAAAPAGGFIPSAEQASWPAAKWFNEGLKLEQTDKGRYVEYLRQALRIDPNFAPAYYNLGYESYERNQYRDARAYFERYLVLSPSSPDAAQIRELVETLKKY